MGVGVSFLIPIKKEECSVIQRETVPALFETENYQFQS